MSHSGYKEGRNPSRKLALYAQAQLLARQADHRAIVACGYCWQELPPGSEYQYDHTTGEDDDLESILVTCPACNAAAGRHDRRGMEILADHLRDMGHEDPAENIRTAAAIVRRELDLRNSERVVYIAEKYLGERIQYQRVIAAKRRGTDPSVAGTGRTRARQLELASVDDFDAF